METQETYNFTITVMLIARLAGVSVPDRPQHFSGVKEEITRDTLFPCLNQVFVI